MRGLQSTLVLGATALCAANTQAAVIVKNFNRTVTNGWGDAVSFSYDALNEMIFEEISGFTGGSAYGISAGFWSGKGAVFQKMQFPDPYRVALPPFASGDSVGDAATWQESSFPVTSGNYVGLRVDQGSGNYNYGYAKYSVNDTSLTLESVAFETEFNTAIVTPIPEPSASLLGLAGGAAALLGIRRRKAA